MVALAIAGYLADAGFYDEAAALARDAFAQGERWMGASFDTRLFYVPGVALAQAAAGADFGVETQLRAGIARAEANNTPNADQETADVRAALALWLISRGRYDEARAPLDHALKLQNARSVSYNQYVTQLRIWQIALTVLSANNVAETSRERVDAVAALLSLRALADGAAGATADNANLPRIDALLAALEPDAARADAHWQRAVSAMLTSDFRPGDAATLLRALKSTRSLPPAVDDNVVADMRTYARKVMAVTDQGIAARAAQRR
jgi:tetratricopeptide (TPR) repeat protein